jgi:PAS domain-containing protein
VTAETGRESTPRPLAALAGLGRMASANLIGRVTSTPDGVRDANDAFLRLAGYTRQDLEAGRVHWRTLTAPEWTDLDTEGVAELKAYGSYGPPSRSTAARMGPA